MLNFKVDASNNPPLFNIADIIRKIALSGKAPFSYLCTTSQSFSKNFKPVTDF